MEFALSLIIQKCDCVNSVRKHTSYPLSNLAVRVFLKNRQLFNWKSLHLQTYRRLLLTRLEWSCSNPPPHSSCFPHVDYPTLSNSLVKKEYFVANFLNSIDKLLNLNCSTASLLSLHIYSIWNRILMVSSPFRSQQADLHWFEWNYKIN